MKYITKSRLASMIEARLTDLYNDIREAMEIEPSGVAAEFEQDNDHMRKQLAVHFGDYIDAERGARDFV